MYCFVEAKVEIQARLLSANGITTSKKRGLSMKVRHPLCSHCNFYEVYKGNILHCPEYGEPGI